MLYVEDVVARLRRSAELRRHAHRAAILRLVDAARQLDVAAAGR